MHGGISQQLEVIHNQLKHEVSPHIQRLAVAVYDQESDELRTFVHSTDSEIPVNQYHAKLADVPSLQQLAKSGNPRVINDLTLLSHSNSHHTKRLLEVGFLSSYTVPILNHGHLQGFIFFDADKKQLFNNSLQQHLMIYAQLISAILSNDMVPLRTLRGAVTTAREFSRCRDEETSSHINRMSHYAHTISYQLAESHQLSDEYCEYILRFAPLHDLGKIAIPDQLLMKPGLLTTEEREIVKSHVNKGTEIIDLMIQEFNLGCINHITILRNIIAHHHEQYDGNGYPHKLAGESIPLEARIVAVADVFDALTSKRPYKDAWPLEMAMEYLQARAGKHFDHDCVNALHSQMPYIESVHNHFRDETF